MLDARTAVICMIVLGLATALLLVLQWARRRQKGESAALSGITVPFREMS